MTQALFHQFAVYIQLNSAESGVDNMQNSEVVCQQTWHHIGKQKTFCDLLDTATLSALASRKRLS